MALHNNKLAEDPQTMQSNNPQKEIQHTNSSPMNNSNVQPKKEVQHNNQEQSQHNANSKENIPILNNNGNNSNSNLSNNYNMLNLNQAKNLLNTPGLFPFDLSQWEDNHELNMLLDSQNQLVDSPSILSNAMSPAFNNMQHMGGNQTKLPVPVDSTPNYSEQLQHYQNMLAETQTLLTMKQMQHHNQNDESQLQQQQQRQQQQQQIHPHQLQQQQQLQQHQSPQLQQKQTSQQYKQGVPDLSAALINDPSFVNLLAAYNPQQQNLLQQQLSQLTQSQANTPQAVSQASLQNLTNNPLILQSLLTNPLFSQNMLQQQQQNLMMQNNVMMQNQNQNQNGSTAKISSPSSQAILKSKKKTELPQPRTKVRPCDHCRRRKTKCVMIQDIQSCKICQQKGLKCVFNETSLKRTNSGSDYDGNKRMKFEDPTIEPPPNVLVRDTPPIKDYATMQGHSLLKKTLSLQFPRSSFYVGPTSIYDSVFLQKVALDKIDQFQINKSNSIRKVANSVQFLLRDDYTELLYEQSERDSDTVEKYVAPHGQTLIDLYFKTVHPSFPVIHKKIFLEKYTRTHREFGAPLLAAVYLLAIQWWDFEPKLAKVEKPDVVSLYRFALRTFSDVTQRPKLSAVQAGLLLLQCQYIVDRPEPKNDPKKQSKDQTSIDNEKSKSEFVNNQNNWLICTQVVGLAEELGLGLDCSTWRLPKWERGLRRRLAWAVYVQDKWSSLVESRPSHILDDINWIVRPLTDEDFPERISNTNDSVDKNNNSIDSITNVDIEMGRECFKYIVLLSTIVSEIQSSIYSPRAMLEINDIENILQIAKPLQLKLRQWYHSLPKNLQMKGNQTKKFHANGNLQLSYFAAEITLHRRIISILYNQVVDQGNENNDMGDGTAKPTPPSPQLITVCRNAARMRLTASIAFVRELNNEHVHSFWHSSAPRNFALIGVFATLLYVTSSTAEEADIYREQINDYRRILSNIAPDFSVAKHALSLIHDIAKNIHGLNDFDTMDPGSTGIESINQTQVPLTATTPSFHQPNAVATPSSNMNPALKRTQTYNYDMSNGVSPKTIPTPNNSRRLPTSNLGTPTNSPHQPLSPLQTMTKSGGTNPATPVLMSQSRASTPRQSQPPSTKPSSPVKTENV